MSEYWSFKCVTCDKQNENSINHGDEILLNVLEQVDTIKKLLDSDKSGLLEVSLLGSGTEPICFLMEHYGEEHEVVVHSEYGKDIKWRCPECGAITDGWYPVEHKPECNYCRNRFEKMDKEMKTTSEKKNTQRLDINILDNIRPWIELETEINEEANRKVDEMTNDELFNAWCKWNGLIGFEQIRKAVENIYQVKLTN